MDELIAVARANLGHVYWLGGPGCSGKSSVTRILGQRCGWRIYDVDAERQHHEPDPSLELARWHGIDFLGVRGTPLMTLPSHDAAQYVIDGWRGVFVQTVRHLLTLPRDQAIIVNGAFLPETLLRVADRDHIACMVASRAFREAHFGHRHAWFAAYADKAAAYRTALEALDLMDQVWVAQCVALQIPLHTVASLADIPEVADRILAQFSGASEFLPGDRATPDGRR
jgi:hypothetical protein